MKAKAAPILLALLLLPIAPASAQDAGGTYVNIGEYTDDVFTAAPVQPMAAPMATAAPVAIPFETYEIVTEPIVEGPIIEGPIIGEPVVMTTDPYTAQPVYGEVQYDPAPMDTLPYQAAPAVAITGFADGEYEAARLAAYDANRDGTVTTAEAIATLRPLAGQ